MQVLVDGQALQSPETSERGIGRYCRNLISATAAARPAWQIELVQNAHLPPIDPNRLPPVPIRGFTPPIAAAPANRDLNERYYADWLTAMHPDAILLSSCFDPCVLAPRFEGPRPALFALLYDLIPLALHRHYLQGQSQRAAYGRRFRQLLRCDHVLALSRAGAQDLQQAARDTAAQVTVIGGAADPCFKPYPPKKLLEYQRSAKTKLGIDQDFLLYVGGGDYRKNLSGGVEAYSSLPEALRRCLLLTIVGRLDTEQIRALDALAKRLGVAASLRVLGFVSDEELAALYQLCRLVLFPSLHEGLGLPLLEALNCGAPVVASNRAAMPEFAGSVCRLADPRDPHAFAQVIVEALAGPRDNGRADRLLHASRFTWDKTAEALCNTIEGWIAKRSIVAALFTPRHSPKPGQRGEPDVPSAPYSRGADQGEGGKTRRRRVAWVSPVPPSSSGIADYSAELLPHLAERFEIELVIDPLERQVTGTISADHTVLRADEIDGRHDARPYDAFVFHLGNSHFHVYMLDLLRRFRGLVVLHDLHLAGLIGAATRAGMWPHGRAGELEADGQVDLSGSTRADLMLEEAVLEGCPFNRELLGLAEAVIVHSEWARQRVSRLVQVPTQIVQPAMAPQPRSQEQERSRLGWPPDAFVIATLGEVRPSKRVASIIQAVAALRRSSGRQIQFVIVGDVESELQNALISLAKSLGIPSSLSFAGRVSLEDFKSYAQAADACVQLRHPTRGETSAALLRALAAGAACVVSADGPMGELPDTVVLKVRSRHESTDLVAALARLMGDSGLRGQLGHAALSHVQTHHSFRQAADGYAAMIELTAHRRQARNALWLEGACDALAVSRDPQITKLILPWARLRLRGQTALRASSRASPP
jgi:glycosyltransferase involved in cell wall biosynthesis